MGHAENPGEPVPRTFVNNKNDDEHTKNFRNFTAGIPVSAVQLFPIINQK
jgi:hypothetical protein